jgi:type IV pilus assembly protein PilA
MMMIATRVKPSSRRRHAFTISLHRLRQSGMNPLKARNDGFTMMEMMAVVAVIGILAMLAVPSYLDRIVREQIKAALPLADLARQPVAASWALTQTFPADNAAVGLPPAEKIVANFVSAVAVEDGAIHITFGNRVNRAIAGKLLTLRPAVVEDAPIVPVAWVCGYAEAPDKMTIRGTNLTSIPAALLPPECRALKQ